MNRSIRKELLRSRLGRVVMPGLLLGLALALALGFAGADAYGQSIATSSSAEAEAELVSFNLNEAVEVALHLNPEVLGERERTTELGGLVREAKAEALPQVSVNLQWHQNRDPGLRNSPFFSRIIEGGIRGAPAGSTPGIPLRELHLELRGLATGLYVRPRFERPRSGARGAERSQPRHPGGREPDSHTTWYVPAMGICSPSRTSTCSRRSATRARDSSSRWRTASSSRTRPGSTCSVPAWRSPTCSQKCSPPRTSSRWRSPR